MQKLLRRIVYIFRHRRLEAELAEEMEFHRSMLAHRSPGGGGFGNATLAREDARAVWLPPSLESVWQDVVYAVRMLWREPAFALLAIGALTAGIGLNSSLFTVYSALALKPWAVRDSESVVRLSNNSTFDLRKRAGGGPSGFSQAELDYFTIHATTISGAVTIGRRVAVRVGDADTDASWVGGAYFTMLGVDMALGRGFVAGEDRVDSPTAVAVISHGFWRRQFGGDPAMAGRQIRLDDVPFTVVGVAGPGFLGTTTDRVDVWMPVASAPLLRPDDRWVRAVGQQPRNCCTPAAARLAPGFTREQAAAELTLLSRQFRGPRPNDSGGISVRGTQVFADPKGDAAAVFLPLFLGMVLVLLLACANVGNLLLARCAARRREIAVRLSLGASRVRIIRQLMTESVVLAAAASVAGIVVAAWLPGRMLALLAPGPLSLQLQPDATVLAFTVIVALIATMTFGLAPALHGTRSPAIVALKEGSALHGARFSLRTILLSVQVAAVVVLLVAAGIMARSASRAADRALPASARDLAVVTISPPVRGYDAARVRALSLQLQQELTQSSVALTSTPAFGSGNIKGGFRLPGSPDDHYNAVFEVSPAYFVLMGTPIVDGRGLQPDDTGRSVIVVNETMARQFWPGRRAVGQRIVCTPPESGWNIPGELEIVGVVKDAYVTEVDQIPPTVFQPLTHRALPNAVAANRASADAIVAAAARLDPRLRVRVQSLGEGLGSRLRTARVGALIAGMLGAIALGFACIGMFGVFAYWVRQRTQEIGVRMALGAQSSDVIRLVLGTTARAVGIGVVAGLVMSMGASSLLRAYLFGLSGIDAVTYLAVSALLVAASLLAAFIPARRATRIDPLVALRYE
jgi:predicted permease